MNKEGQPSLSERPPSGKSAVGVSATLDRGETENAVARIWASALGLEHVDAHDNFLLLGGESLLATQVASMIRTTFNRDVSIRSILVGTVADVAAEITRA